MDLLGPDETKDKVSNQVYENLQAVKVLEAALTCEQMLPTGMARPAPRELVMVCHDGISLVYRCLCLLGFRFERDCLCFQWRKIAKEIFIPTHGDVVLPDDSTTDFNAGPECAVCAVSSQPVQPLLEIYGPVV